MLAWFIEKWGIVLGVLMALVGIYGIFNFIKSKSWRWVAALVMLIVSIGLTLFVFEKPHSETKKEATTDTIVQIKDTKKSETSKPKQPKVITPTNELKILVDDFELGQRIKEILEEKLPAYTVTAHSNKNDIERSDVVCRVRKKTSTIEKELSGTKYISGNATVVLTFEYNGKTITQISGYGESET